MEPTAVVRMENVYFKGFRREGINEVPLTCPAEQLVGALIEACKEANPPELHGFAIVYEPPALAVAKKLRRMVDGGIMTIEMIREYADELDPPKPEPAPWTLEVGEWVWYLDGVSMMTVHWTNSAR